MGLISLLWSHLPRGSLIKLGEQKRIKPNFHNEWHMHSTSKRIHMEHAGSGEQQQPPANKQTVPISVNPSAPLLSPRRSILVLWSETFPLTLFSPPPPPTRMLAARGETGRARGRKVGVTERKEGGEGGREGGKKGTEVRESSH